MARSPPPRSTPISRGAGNKPTPASPSSRRTSQRPVGFGRREEVRWLQREVEFPFPPSKKLHDHGAVVGPDVVLIEHHSDPRRLAGDDPRRDGAYGGRH